MLPAMMGFLSKAAAVCIRHNSSIVSPARQTQMSVTLWVLWVEAPLTAQQTQLGSMTKHVCTQQRRQLLTKVHVWRCESHLPLHFRHLRALHDLRSVHNLWVQC